MVVPAHRVFVVLVLEDVRIHAVQVDGGDAEIERLGEPASKSRLSPRHSPPSAIAAPPLRRRAGNHHLGLLQSSDSADLSSVVGMPPLWVSSDPRPNGNYGADKTAIPHCVRSPTSTGHGRDHRCAVVSASCAEVLHAEPIPHCLPQRFGFMERCINQGERDRPWPRAFRHRGPLRDGRRFAGFMYLLPAHPQRPQDRHILTSKGRDHRNRVGNAAKTT